MKIDTVEAFYLDRMVMLTTAELVEHSGLTEVEVVALVECGAVTPSDPQASTWTFSGECLAVARTAVRLREQYALEDTHALALVLLLTQRIAALEDALRRRP